jgi:APA family basic amino acid/polyamine antiporter
MTVTPPFTRSGSPDRTMVETLNETTPQSPVPRLGMWAAVALVVSEVVGIGIFLAPATLTRTFGSVWAALLVWVSMAGVTVAGALCYAELATRFPRAGGAYVFLREGFGLRCAFVYGWMALLVVDPGLVAVLGIALARYLLVVVGGSPDLLVPLAAAIVIGFGLLTLLGVDVSARVIQWTVVLKLLAVAVLVLAGVSFALENGNLALVARIARPPTRPETLATAITVAFFAFGGWWELGRMSEEVTRPRRTIPNALLGGVGLVTVMYALVTIAFMFVAADLAMASLAEASDEALVAAVGTALFGEAAARVVAGIVVVAVSGTLAAVLLRAPRGYLAMARDGVFPRRVAGLDARRGTSPTSTIIQVSLACGLLFFGTFEEILGYFVPAALFFVGLGAAAVLRVPRPSRDRATFRMPLYPLPLAAFLLATSAMLIVLCLGRPSQTLLGAGVLVIAVVLSRAVIPNGSTTASRDGVGMQNDHGIMVP